MSQPETTAILSPVQWLKDWLSASRLKEAARLRAKAGGMIERAARLEQWAKEQTW